MSDHPTPSAETSAAGSGNMQSIDRAVTEGGAYEVLRRRLGEQGQQLGGEPSHVVEQPLAQRLAPVE